MNNSESTSEVKPMLALTLEELKKYDCVTPFYYCEPIKKYLVPIREKE